MFSRATPPPCCIRPLQGVLRTYRHYLALDLAPPSAAPPGVGRGLSYGAPCYGSPSTDRQLRLLVADLGGARAIGLYY